ncbi:GNAT family N-acetyltransferase [Bacillus alkalicellulosilyticus]|uniref:GNAT family N-acetyltransferase n=1 Tax=Alkalihalobacterium alkalicellulosilyticum TaxID=1912214 RepID=UPI001115E83F|nr:GNAT family N-acetyltransferase [Bacillus alkalicellulosilyticus]
MRKAIKSDIRTIALRKLDMFKEVGMDHMIRYDFIESVVTTYHDLYTKDKAIHFVIEENDRIVACAGGFIKEDLPYCFYKNPQYGFIGDVYVEPPYRNQGYAKKVTNEVLQWFESRDIHTIRLLASDKAKRLYKSIGFVETEEMIFHRK